MACECLELVVSLASGRPDRGQKDYMDGTYGHLLFRETVLDSICFYLIYQFLVILVPTTSAAVIYIHPRR